jgi:hypothetical protein
MVKIHIWAILGQNWAIFGHNWAIFGQNWAIFGQNWAIAFTERLVAVRGWLWPIF